MGLIKRDRYTIKGVELPQAYAKITRLYVERGSNAKVYFGISNNRENLNEDKALEEIMFECSIDKNQNVYEQIYTKSKESLFENWEDDIVIEEHIENEVE